MKSTMIAAGIACLLLAACSQQSSSVSDGAIASAESSNFQTLSDNTQRIEMTVPAQFTIMPDAKGSGLPDENNVTLLAHNETDDITLYVTRVGELKTTPDKYFAQLGDLIKQQTAYGDIKVGIATENRMNYQFSQGEGDEKTNESCLAVIGGQELYTVCVYGSNQPFDTLSKYLKDVRIAK